MDSARALRELEQQREALRQRELELRRREARLRAERTGLRASARRLERETKKQLALREELKELIGATEGKALMRRVLELRYVEGLTFALIRSALDAEGLYYGERHIDRVLRGGEQALAAEWLKRKEKNA